MKNNEVVNLELQLSTDQVEASIDKITTSIEGLKKNMGSVVNELSKVFTTIQTNIEVLAASIEQMTVPITELAKCLNAVAESNFSALVTELSNLKGVLNNIFEQQEEQQVQDLVADGFSTGINAAQLSLDIYKLFSENNSNPKGKGKSGKKVKVRKKSSGSNTASSKSRVSEMVAGSGGAAQLGGVDDIVDGITSSGNGLLDGSLASAFSDITTKLKNSAAATWLQNAATIAWQGISKAATAVTTAFGVAMKFLTSPITWVVIGITALIAIIVVLIANWDTVSAAVVNFMDTLRNGLAQFDAFVQSLFSVDWTQYLGPLGNVFNAFFANIKNIWNAIKTVLDGIITFVGGIFAGDWNKAWEGIVNIFKGMWEGMKTYVTIPINYIIAAINTIAQVIVGFVNGIGSIAGNIGAIFGKDWGFSVPENAFQIPYLAKGAVLPANKPFLAMVGDQRHGTNVEAPLATIQEAVALVMEDQFNGMMTGFQAVTARQEQILETLLGIEIGDTTIGQAAARYNRKMAIIKGGM